MRDSDNDGIQDIGLKRAKQIFLYSDSEPNEVLIGLLHAIILPLAMFEMGDPSFVFQLLASATGWFQLYSVLYNGTLRIRKIAVQLATLVAVATCVNYYMLDMLNGSHFGWLLILIFAVWNLVRVTRESLSKG